jgi:hypothetical protein
MATDAVRSLQAKAAVHTSWARTDDRTRRTANAFRDRFENEVDPDGELAPAERGPVEPSARARPTTRTWPASRHSCGAAGRPPHGNPNKRSLVIAGPRARSGRTNVAREPTERTRRTG